MGDEPLDPNIVDDVHNAWIHVDADAWRRARAEHEQRCESGRLNGPLDGLSVGIKDNMHVADMPTTHGSGAFADAGVAEADADVVASAEPVRFHPRYGNAKCTCPPEVNPDAKSPSVPWTNGAASEPFAAWHLAP